VASDRCSAILRERRADGLRRRNSDSARPARQVTRGLRPRRCSIRCSSRSPIWQPRVVPISCSTLAAGREARRWRFDAISGRVLFSPSKSFRATFHGHSGVCARVLALQLGKGRSMNNDSDSRSASAPTRGPRAVRIPPCGRLKAHECAKWWKRLPAARVMRAALRDGTSHRTRIGWTPRVLGARRLRVTSGPPPPRFRRRNTARPESHLGTRNVEVRGCVRYRETQDRIAIAGY
jgi:hypothetical protein